jgi:hypothetical protein
MIYYLILMYALADRIRGDAFQPVVFNFNHRLSAYVVLGWTFAALTGHVFDYLTLPIALLLVAGASSGLSEPLGALNSSRPMIVEELEWWQFGWMKTNALLATTFRGLMWGVPVALLTYFDHSLIWALPAFTVAMPAAVLISRQWLKSDWQYMEFIRGFIAASLFVYFKSLGV